MCIRDSSYVSLAAGCSKREDILVDAFSAPSRGTCSVYCNRMVFCEAFAFHEGSGSCILKRQCADAVHGPCPARRQNGWCVYSRGHTYSSGQQLVWLVRASSVNRGFSILSDSSRQLSGGTCRTPHFARGDKRSRALPSTIGKPWRYYNVFECDNGPAERAICFTAKKGGGKVIGARSYRSSLGITRWHLLPTFDPAQSARLSEEQFSHNMAILRSSGAGLIMVGGM
eukprot:475773-Prymnesium_polylepis.1